MTNKMLAALEPLLGEWDAVVSEARFLDGVDDTIKGEAGIGRELGGAVVVMRTTYADKRIPVGKWVIGVDDDHHTYSVLYHDSRDVSRIFEMSFEGGLVEIWRYKPGFSQRFTATLDNKGKTLAGEWQFSSDGVSWHRDFRVTYTKKG